MGTRVAFPDYIARRPVMALEACKWIADTIRDCHKEGREFPFNVPPFSVMMYLEMIGMLKELTPEGVVIAFELPPDVKKWM
jgi:hypothetical protein